MVEGTLCRSAGEIQTQNLNIYNTDEVIKLGNIEFSITE